MHVHAGVTQSYNYILSTCMYPCMSSCDGFMNTHRREDVTFHKVGKQWLCLHSYIIVPVVLTRSSM